MSARTTAYGIARRCAVLLPAKKQSRIVASPSRRDMEAKGEASADRRTCGKSAEEE